MQTIHHSRSRRWLFVILRIAVALVLLAFVGFLVVFWWTAPVYLSDVVDLTEVRIDGVPISNESLTLVATKEYRFSCTAITRRAKFVIADSGDVAYLEPMPFIPASQHDVPKGRFDPTFQLTFASNLRLGRPVSFMIPTRVKTNGDGESALLHQRIKTPTQPGIYKLHLLWVNNPDGWVQLRPNMWTQRTQKNDAIVWRHTVNVVRGE